MSESDLKVFHMYQSYFNDFLLRMAISLNVDSNKSPSRPMSFRAWIHIRDPPTLGVL